MRIKLRANWLYKGKKTNQLAERKPCIQNFQDTALHHCTGMFFSFFHTKKAIHLNELKVQQQENLWLTKCE